MSMSIRPLVVVVCLGTVLSSCSSPGVRYLNYRLFPDRLPRRQVKEVRAAGLERPVTIWLDSYDVPHILSDSEAALYFAYGYMQGRDRRAQMEILRLIAMGRLREFVGEQDRTGTVTRLDIFSRMVGIPEDAEALLASTSPKTMALLEAFSAGVNAATDVEPTPMEFRLMDYRPAPWTPFDTCAIVALVSFGLSKNWEMELGRLELIVHQLRTGGSLQRALEIWKPRADLGPHMIGEKPASDPFAGISPIAPELEAYLVGNFTGGKPLGPAAASRTHSSQDDEDDAASGLAPALALFAGGFSSSNNWAVDGRWTGTGKAAYASDPHMPHMLPPLGYLAHLECRGCEGGDFRIIGATFIGIPAIVFGTNGLVAWGATSNWADGQDLYVEKPIPGRPDCYEVDGRPVPFETRQEGFKIRRNDGSYSTEVRTVRETRHGVVLNDFIDRLPENFPVVTLKRNREPGRPIEAFSRLYRSRDVTQARDALHEFTAMVGHWVLADAEGSIAYVGPLVLPKRTRHLGTVPVPGWVDTYEWTSFVPVSELPAELDPERGWIGTANNQVVQPESLGYPINCEGDVAYRFIRIKRLLEAGRTGEPIAAELASQQLDNVDAGWDDVRELFTRAIAPLADSPDPLLRRSAALLLSWDGRSDDKAVGPSIFQALCAHILRRTMEDEVAPGTLRFILTYFNIEPFAYGIFADPGNPAWDDRRTPRCETAPEVIAGCFEEAVAGLARAYGRNPDSWAWSRVAPWHVEHFFGKKKVLAGYLNREAPTRGAINTVAKHQFERLEMTSFPIKHGPVARVVVDLDDLGASRMSLPGGQSGRPSSTHYDDQLPLFLEGKGVSMEMDLEKIARRAVGKIVLEPAAPESASP